MNRISRVFISAAFVFVLLTAALFAVKPIDDYDFWWHLRTGKYIYEEGRLPEKDPFLYTTSGEPDARGKLILRSYWLSQMSLYLSYLAGGFTGVAALRWIILFFTFAVLYLRLGEESRDPLLKIPLFLVCIFVFGALYRPDRPFVLSFLFALLLIRSLEGIKKGKCKGYIIPPLMLVWGNCHAGYVLGIVVIFIYIFFEGIKFIVPSTRPIKRKAYAGLSLWGGAGVVFSFINPASLNLIPALLSSYGVDLYKYNLEFKSSIYYFNEIEGGWIMLLYWTLIAVCIIAFVLNPRRLDITDAALVVSLGVFSFFQIRHIAFFLFAGAPIAARYLDGSIDSLKKRFGHFKSVAAVLLLAVSVSAFASAYGAMGTGGLGRGWVDKRNFPYKAADFVEREGIGGNLYNGRDWGGFLVYRFYPGRKLFNDGRDMDVELYHKTIDIEGGNAEPHNGLPRWKALLDLYEINSVLIPLRDNAGNLLPLARAMKEDDDWRLVYFYDNALVFVRDAEVNRNIIAKHAMPKGVVIP